MLINLAIDGVSALLLLCSLLFLWRERKRFVSLTPLIPALACVIAGRACDILLEHPGLAHLDLPGLPQQQLLRYLTIAGNLTDVAGFALLIYGFIRIVRSAENREKRIQELETLLPLCSNCKKYRSPQKEWLPIETYLSKIGAPTVTHGICPECLEKLYGRSLRKRPAAPEVEKTPQGLLVTAQSTRTRK